MGVEKNRCINSQYDAVDVVKLISCILVVAIHVKPFGAEESDLNLREGCRNERKHIT